MQTSCLEGRRPSAGSWAYKLIFREFSLVAKRGQAGYNACMKNGDLEFLRGSRTETDYQGDDEMTAFFPELLHAFAKPDFLEKVRKKYHFDEAHRNEIRTVAVEMQSVMRKEAFWETQDIPMHKAGRGDNQGTVYENVAMSLGSGVDALQDHYSAEGLLLRSYIVEVLAGELLMRAYEAYNRSVTERTAWHVARYHFPGSEEDFPLEMLPRLLENVEQKITCNSAFCMRPKKSVVFIAELTRDMTVHCEGICVGCTNRSCTNRIEGNHFIEKQMPDVALTYGYSRIFGIVT